MSDKSKAEELKNQGNAALQQGKTDEAISLYSQAIAIDANNHAYFSNRSAAYAKIYRFEEALNDAEKSVQINEKWGKGYQRKGVALHGLRRFKEAIEAFKIGLTLEPENAQIKSGLEESERALKFEQQQEQNQRSTESIFKTFADLFKGDVVSRIRTMPEVAHLADDKEFLKKIELINKDPNKMAEYLQDERIKTYLTTALQYQTVQQMSNEDRAKLVQKQEEMRQKREKAEEEERERKRKQEKELKESEERRRKEEELSKLTQDQRKALEIKESANKLYTEKKFLEALPLYEEASKLDPTNLVYLNNICAVHLELKDYQKTIVIGNNAVEVGRANHAPFEAIGRALQRIGTAYSRLGDYENAIMYYQKSLTEHRDGNTLTLLKKVEKAYEEKKKQDYISPELSQKAKEEGNSLFRENKFADAIEKYSEAIKRNPTDHTIYTNRAQTYVKLMALPEALRDCEECIKLKPDFVKAYLKKGQIHFMMKEYQKALKTYEQALEFDPENAELSEAVSRTVQAVNRQEDMDPETVKRNVEKDPELQAILADPVMQQVLKDLQNDPRTAAGYMQDERIRKNLEKLIAAGIISTR